MKFFPQAKTRELKHSGIAAEVFSTVGEEQLHPATVRSTT
jgi:hypothetical protein